MTQAVVEINGIRLSGAQVETLAFAMAGFWSDMQADNALGDEPHWRDIEAQYCAHAADVVGLLRPPTDEIVFALPDADVLFGDAVDHGGLKPVPPTTNALCAAIEIWLLTRPPGTHITVRQAAAAFNVSPALLIEAFDHRANPHFYIFDPQDGEPRDECLFVREAA